MLIFNTTYLIPDAHLHAWLHWVRNEHIPFMLENGFAEPRVAKVLTDKEQHDGNSVSVQFYISDMEMLNTWQETKAQEFEDALFRLFGREILSFSTLLEEM